MGNLIAGKTKKVGIVRHKTGASYLIAKLQTNVRNRGVFNVYRLNADKVCWDFVRQFVLYMPVSRANDEDLANVCWGVYFDWFGESGNIRQTEYKRLTTYVKQQKEKGKIDDEKWIEYSKKTKRS